MRAAFHTLGCKVNQYETEVIKRQFEEGGFEIVPDNEIADVYVVNTCTVTNMADRKSRQFIRHAYKNNPDAIIAVTGCYAQIKPEEVSAIEGVQIVAGTDEKGRLLDMVNDWLLHRQKTTLIKSYDDIKEYEALGEISGMDERTRAFIKIQDGCNNFCTYCIIPYARGKIRSRDKAEIVHEVKGLVAKGYKEIVLTGINTAFYGKEKGGLGIEPLIAELNEIPGDFRIRLSSLEPTVIDADYVKNLLKYDKLCHHLHLALQSGSDNVLGAMRRGYSRQDFLDIVKVLRDFDPLYGISTDIIVGFPGESEEDFMNSMNMVRECEFCKVHVFPYSPREGTIAAGMSGQISGDVKKARSKRLIELSYEVAREFCKKCIGADDYVLAERYDIDPISGESQGKAGEDESGNSNPDMKNCNGNRLDSDDTLRKNDTSYITGYTGNYLKAYFPGDETCFNNIKKVKILQAFQDGVLCEVKH